MPLRGSTRIKRPSVRAVGEPRRRRTRQSVGTNPDVPVEGASDNPPTVDANQVSLPAGLLDQLVSRVADEVTRRLSPSSAPVHNLPSTLGSQSGATMPNSANATLSEVPFSLANDEAQVGRVIPSEVTAATVVQRSLESAQQVLSGELPVVTADHMPPQLFSSYSLPIDARV